MSTLNKGFTLIETMVAITVLALALIGPFSAVQSALNGSYVARDQLVATALAQEGAEYIRSIRDNNYLDSTRTGGWLDGFSTNLTNCYSSVIGATPTGYCTVDVTKGDFHSAASAVTSYTSSQTPPPLYQDASHFFTQVSSGNTATKFTRTVRITTLTTNEGKVVVTVTWTAGHQTHSITVTDNLQNWL